MLRLANVITAPSTVTDVSLAERQCFGSCTFHEHLLFSSLLEGCNLWLVVISQEYCI